MQHEGFEGGMISIYRTTAHSPQAPVNLLTACEVREYFYNLAFAGTHD